MPEGSGASGARLLTPPPGSSHPPSEAKNPGAAPGNMGMVQRWWGKNRQQPRCLPAPLRQHPVGCREQMLLLLSRCISSPQLKFPAPSSRLPEGLLPHPHTFPLAHVPYRRGHKDGISLAALTPAGEEPGCRNIHPQNN